VVDQKQKKTTSGNDIVPKQEMRIAACFDIMGKRFANKTPKGTTDPTMEARERFN
jgi:hypothetical protein